MQYFTIKGNIQTVMGFFSFCREQFGATTPICAISQEEFNNAKNIYFGGKYEQE